MAAANLISAPAGQALRGGPGRATSTSDAAAGDGRPGATSSRSTTSRMMTGLDVRPAVAAREDIEALDRAADRLDERRPRRRSTRRRAERRRGHRPARVAPTTRRSSSSSTRSSPRRSSRAPRHPLRARRARDARPLPHRRRAAGATTVPKRMVAGASAAIKIMSDLDIAERRIPQDGRVGLTSTAARRPARRDPAERARRVDRRPHPRQGRQRRARPRRARLARATSTQRFERAIRQPLRRRARHRADRLGQVDDALRGARRCSTTPRRTSSRSRTRSSTRSRASSRCRSTARAGLTFATGLRSIMRADPDIIMVGEIRDRETAQIAVEAALTGHMVLSTLHTNDAPTAITRLTEMGIEPFLVASALDCVVAQRLARTLCMHCKQAVILTQRGPAPTTASSTSTSRPTSPSAARAAAAPATTAGSASTRS